jgi:hypothetical protein
MTEDPPSATAQRPDLPASIDAVIAAGMAKEPSERPPSASALMRRAAEALGVSAIETVAATPPARRRTALIAGVVAAVAVVAVIAGFLLGGSGGGDGALNSSASAGNIQLNFPDGWERRTGSGGIPGLDLPLPLVLAPPGQSDDVIVAGRANQPGPGLLPRELTRLLPRRPRGEAVRLGRFEALRYADLRPFGLDGMATVFAVPTTTGVVLVGCRDRGSPSFGEDCERVAGTLRVLRAKPVRLPPER